MNSRAYRPVMSFRLRTRARLSVSQATAAVLHAVGVRAVNPRPRARRRWPVAAICRLLVVAATACPAISCAHEPDQLTSYFDGLRARELFGVAERYGLDRRSELPVEAAESVQLSVELSRTFAAHAQRVADTQERAFLEQRALEALEDYQGTEPYPRIQAVAFERIHRQIDRARSAWWDWTADPDDSDARMAAAQEFAAAHQALENWIEVTAGTLASASKIRTSGELTRRELALLLHDAKLKSIDLLLQGAELAVTANERDRLLRKSQDGIKRLTGSPERGTTAALRGFSIRQARLSGDENELRFLVRQTTTDRTPLEVRQAAIAELARFELTKGRFEAAARLLVDAKASAGTTTDELRALHVEAVLGMWRAAGGQRDDLLASAEAGHAQTVGPWRLRNESLLQDARNAGAYGAEAAALVRRGRREFRTGRRPAALATFQQAAEVATVPAGRAELRFMLASLYIESRQFESAIAESTRVTVESVTQELAARASLLTAYSWGQLAAAGANADARRQYETAIRRHLEKFPDDPTAGDASLMLGALAEAEGRLAGVVEADHAMPAEHRRAGESTSRAIRATLEALARLRDDALQEVDGRSAVEWSDDARRLAGRVTPPAGSTGVDAAENLLNAARLLAAIPAPEFREVLALLNRISPPAGASSDAVAWERIAQDAAALRLVCLTATGAFADAAATLEQLRTVSSEDLMGVLSKLSAAGRQLSGARRVELAKLELETIHRIRLQGGGLPREQRQLLAECEAEALLATGRFEEAVRMFDEAAEGRPELTPRLADALMKTGRPQDLQRARALWQQHEAQQKQGTRTWFEARLHLAECLAALGQSAEVRKLIVSTRIVYPELGGPDLKSRFGELERNAANP